MEPILTKTIAEAMRRPEGTVTFRYTSADAFAVESPAGIIMEVRAGAHVFRLDRTASRVLRFFHASPGTGTRVAEITLQGLPEFDQAYLAFTWTLHETHFYCGPRLPGAELISASGRPSDMKLVVGRNGRILQIGDTGVEVLDVRIRESGRLLLTPFAINAWAATLKAVDILWTGKSGAGFMYEVVQSNVTLSILVTGFETYARTRLIEVEAEGIQPDWSRLFDVFASQAERESGRLRELQDEAISTGRSILEMLVESGRINFQNWENLKRAYKAAYGIGVGDLAVDPQTLEQLQRFIKHRHRVVHVSPLLGLLNEESVPPDEPVFANRATAERAVACFGEFIQALHERTLGLRPTD